MSTTHDLGKIVALVASNFESSQLNGKTITVAERVYSNQEILDILHKVSVLPNLDSFFLTSDLFDLSGHRA